ncbi:MAG: GIY-YIG nuclease family protein [Dehalococcoidia bacterium]|nr:GIY-YIG nuclease family protein [Dehalococcoidia bacterium]
MAFTVYVLRNVQGRLYIGQTSDLPRRLTEHASGESRWTSGSGRGPWELVRAEEFETRAEAMARERQLKSGRANQDLRREFGPARGS